MRVSGRLPTWLGGLLILGVCSALACRSARAAEARHLVAGEDVRPGLLALLGCPDGAVAAGLRLDGKYVVHALTDDEEALRGLREGIRGAGVCGRASAELHDMRALPYADDLVNVIVAEDWASLRSKGLSVAEVYRALAPYGTAFLERASAADVKAGLDGEAAGVTQVEGWVRIDKPYPEAMDEWTQYAHDASQTYVSQDGLVGPLESIRWIAGDKFFTGRYVSPNVVSAGGRVFFLNKDRGYRGCVECRDAFNGLLLWKTGEQEGVRGFAADSERLYVLKDGLKAWSAVTGEHLYDFESPTPVWPALLLDAEAGVIVLASSRGGWIKAYAAATGESLWDADGLPGEWGRSHVVIGGSRVYYVHKEVTGEGEDEKAVCSIRARNLRTGEQEAEFTDVFAPDDTRHSVSQYLDGKLIATVSADQAREQTVKTYVVAATDGKVLWDTETDTQFVKKGGFLYLKGLFWRIIQGQDIAGLDPDTGEVARTIAPRHQHTGCNPMVATANYLIGARMHLVDAETGEIFRHTVTRTSCRDSCRMANGLAYFPRHTCACTDSMNGNLAISAAPQLPVQIEPQDAPSRLVRGPAYGKVATAALDPDDWPTYRANAQRGAVVRAPVSLPLARRWETSVGRSASAPVVAAGKVLVAAPEEHRVVCLDAGDGAALWSFTTGARVDSPPTVCGGLAIFGCRDGWVYALRAEDGELAWKLLAAPAKRRIVVQEQVESVWPAFGSVLAEGGLVYVSAGRHVDIDGGIWMYALEPATGKVVWARNVRNPDHTVEHAISSRLRGEGAINDVLRSDGAHVYTAGDFEKVAFNLETGEKVPKVTGLPILSTANDMLMPAGDRALPGGWGDPTNASVTWVYHPGPRKLGMFWQDYHSPVRTSPRFDIAADWGYAADLIVFDGERVFGAGREQDPKREKLAVFGKPSGEAAVWLADPGEETSRLQGMLVAGNVAAVAFGGPYEVDGAEVTRGRIRFYSADNGENLGEVQLDHAPRWDGMAAAGGRLYVSTEDGKVICLGGE